MTTRVVSLSAKPAVPGEPRIACTLQPDAMEGRIEDWQSLLSHVERRDRIDDGLRAVFAASVPTDQLIRLVAAEQECCPFFQFAITVDARGLALEVRAPEDARPIVESMFGAAA